MQSVEFRAAALEYPAGNPVYDISHMNRHRTGHIDDYKRTLYQDPVSEFVCEKSSFERLL